MIGAGGEELGTITFRVIDAGNAIVASPGGQAAQRMPSQVPPAPAGPPKVTPQERAVPRSGGFTSAGVASALAQSTTNPYGSAVGFASMIGGGSLAGPLLLVGGAFAAAAGAVLAFRGAISSLSARMEEIGRFGPATMQAQFSERIAAFNRLLFRSRQGDQDFAALQRSLTSLTNRITPVVSVLERTGASLGAAALNKIDKTLIGIAGGMAGLGAAMSVTSNNTSTIGAFLNQLGNQILGANGPGDLNSIYRDQIDFLTRGMFGSLGPPAPIGMTKRGVNVWP